MSNRRSLYTCQNAVVKGDVIVCDKGYRFEGSLSTRDGNISVLRLQRGTPLEFTICQTCPDYDCMGDPVLEADRGWVTIGTISILAGLFGSIES